MAQLLTRMVNTAHARIIRLGLNRTPLSYLREIQWCTQLSAEGYDSQDLLEKEIQGCGVTSSEDISIVKKSFTRRPVVFKSSDKAYDIQDFSEKMQLLVEFPHNPIRLPIWCSPTYSHYNFANDIIGFCYSVVTLSELDLPYFCIKGWFVALCEGKQWIDFHGKPMTLEECGIKHMDTIRLIIDAPLRIKVINLSSDEKVEEGFYVIFAKYHNTIGELKEKIEKATGIPKQEQRLKYKDWYMDHDRRTIEYYGIMCSSQLPRSRATYMSNINPHQKRRKIEIYLHHDSSYSESKTAESDVYEGLRKKETMQIALEHMARRYPLFVRPTISIGVLRSQIWAHLVRESETTFNTPEKMIELAFGTKILNDESMTLDDYGIKHTDSITIFEKTPIRITIMNLEHESGKNDFFVEMRSFDTIGMLKVKLEDSIGIPKEKQELAYKNAWFLTNHLFLEDEERRLADYGIFDHKIWNLNDPNHHILVATSKEVLVINL